VLSCDVIISDENILLFYFSWKLHSLKKVARKKRGSEGSRNTSMIGKFGGKCDILHYIDLWTFRSPPNFNLNCCKIFYEGERKKIRNCDCA
jgi:hypothetical protein